MNALLDVWTSVVCALAIHAVFTVTLLFYGRVQKTYPGFHLWTGALFAAFWGYFFLLLRPVAPGTSILFSNALFVLSGLLRVDGTLRFMGRPPMRAAWYALAPFVGGVCGYFYFAVDDLGVRVAIVTTALIGLGLAIGRTFLRYGPRDNPLLHRAAGAVMGFYALVLLARGVMWRFTPLDAIFAPAFFQGAFFLGVCMIEVAMLTLFLLMNSQRLEDELHRALHDLQESVAQVRVLTGMLPICANCKQIRDTEGHWHPVEAYVRERSHAEFSHSICPTCMTALYPEFADSE